MTTNWISRLSRACAAFLRAPIRVYGGDASDRDADSRRIRGELDAIRIHFPESA